jgi:hypothetical protein
LPATEPPTHEQPELAISSAESILETTEALDWDEV